MIIWIPGGIVFVFTTILLIWLFNLIFSIVSNCSEPSRMVVLGHLLVISLLGWWLVSTWSRLKQLLVGHLLHHVMLIARVHHLEHHLVVVAILLMLLLLYNHLLVKMMLLLSSREGMVGAGDSLQLWIKFTISLGRLTVILMLFFKLLLRSGPLLVVLESSILMLRGKVMLHLLFFFEDDVIYWWVKPFLVFYPIRLTSICYSRSPLLLLYILMVSACY